MNLTKLQKELSSFPDFESVFYFSNGWSMHQMIRHLVQLSGPCELFVSTFSICEEAIRLFHSLNNEGLIKKITFLFDFNVRNHKIGLLFFLQNLTTNIYFDKCHAKTVIIINDNVRWLAVSSANLNVNSKYEAGIVTRNTYLVDAALLKIQQAVDQSNKLPDNEFI